MFVWKSSLERDPQVMCKNMLVAGRVLRQARCLTIMPIDRDYPPDCTGFIVKVGTMISQSSWLRIRSPPESIM